MAAGCGHLDGRRPAACPTTSAQVDGAPGRRRRPAPPAAARRPAPALAAGRHADELAARLRARRAPARPAPARPRPRWPPGTTMRSSPASARREHRGQHAADTAGPGRPGRARRCSTSPRPRVRHRRTWPAASTPTARARSKPLPALGQRRRRQLDRHPPVSGQRGPLLCSAARTRSRASLQRRVGQPDDRRTRAARPRRPPRPRPRCPSHADQRRPHGSGPAPSQTTPRTCSTDAARRSGRARRPRRCGRARGCSPRSASQRAAEPPQPRRLARVTASSGVPYAVLAGS